jgi:hypothetical protein
MFCAGIFAVVGNAYNTEEGGEWCCMLKFGTIFLSLKSWVSAQAVHKLSGADGLGQRGLDCLRNVVQGAYQSHHLHSDVSADTCGIELAPLPGGQPRLLAASVLWCTARQSPLLSWCHVHTLFEQQQTRSVRLTKQAVGSSMHAYSTNILLLKGSSVCYMEIWTCALTASSPAELNGSRRKCHAFHQHDVLRR